MKDIPALEADAAAADFILSNQAVTEFLDRLDRRYYETWRRTKPDQVEKREQVYALRTGLETFRQELTRMSKAGKVATREAQSASRGGLSVGSRDVPSGSEYVVHGARPY